MGWRSAEFFGQCDDDAFGAAEVTELVRVLVLRHVADELGAYGLQAGNSILDIVYGEHDATHTQAVHRRIRVACGRARCVELAQFKSAVTVRSTQHRDVAS